MTSTGPASSLHTGRRHPRPVAAVLVTAFLVAAAFAAVLAAADRLPGGMAGDDPRLWAFHLIGFGTAALALVDRGWARWLVAGLIAGYIVLGVQMYTALITPGLLTTLGWFVNDTHVGLLVLAEYLAVRNLHRAPDTDGANGTFGR